MPPPTSAPPPYGAATSTLTSQSLPKRLVPPRGLGTEVVLAVLVCSRGGESGGRGVDSRGRSTSFFGSPSPVSVFVWVDISYVARLFIASATTRTVASSSGQRRGGAGRIGSTRETYYFVVSPTFIRPSPPERDEDFAVKLGFNGSDPTPSRIPPTHGGPGGARPSSTATTQDAVAAPSIATGRRTGMLSTERSSLITAAQETLLSSSDCLTRTEVGGAVTRGGGIDGAEGEQRHQYT